MRPAKSKCAVAARLCCNVYRFCRRNYLQPCYCRLLPCVHHAVSVSTTLLASRTYEFVFLMCRLVIFGCSCMFPALLSVFVVCGFVNEFDDLLIQTDRRGVSVATVYCVSDAEASTRVVSSCVYGIIGRRRPALCLCGHMMCTLSESSLCRLHCQFLHFRVHERSEVTVHQQQSPSIQQVC